MFHLLPGFSTGIMKTGSFANQFLEFLDALFGLGAGLGRLLMFDKILSGNRNISCGTCHHSLTGTGDGLSLPVGEGGAGLGVTRLARHEGDSIGERVPRNAPPVFNLGAREITTYTARDRDYPVVLQGRAQDRRSTADLAHLHVRSDKTDALIPLSQLVTVRETTGPAGR